MAFRRSPNPYNTLASPSRNDLLAAREKVAAREREASAHVDSLRDVMDMMSHELAAKQIDPVRTAQLIVQAGERAMARTPVQLPPKGSTARFIVLAGMRARNEKLPDDAD
jgi:hypothetical protein